MSRKGNVVVVGRAKFMELADMATGNMETYNKEVTAVGREFITAAIDEMYASRRDIRWFRRRSKVDRNTEMVNAKLAVVEMNRNELYNLYLSARQARWDGKSGIRRWEGKALYATLLYANTRKFVGFMGVNSISDYDERRNGWRKTFIALTNGDDLGGVSSLHFNLTTFEDLLFWSKAVPPLNMTSF